MISRKREGMAAFAAPLAIGLLILTIIPLLATVAISMTQWDGFHAGTLTCAGLKNYRDILGATAPSASPQPDRTEGLGSRAASTDPLFFRALRNSLAYTAMVVPLELMTALAIALLLNQGTRCTLLLRILVYLPWLLGGVASLIVWSWFLNPQFGWLNAILRAIYRLLGAIAQWRSGHAAQDWPMPGWLFSPAGCKPALVLIHLWSVGGPALILLAGLRRIPLELTECAMLDGAGRWGRLRHVTVPLLRPVLAFNAVIGVIYAMQSFTESLVLQNRAQHDNLVFVSHYLYRTAFESPYRMGRAAAAGSVLMVVIAVLIAPLLALSRRVGWLTDQPQ